MLQLLKPRILVIDDDIRVCEFLTRVFEDTGRYSVEAQTDPFAAMATARGFRPDVLFVDIRMPGLGGLELTAEIRTEPSLFRCPIILFSGLDPHELLQPVPAKGGPIMFLAKGASASKLIATVDRLLEEEKGNLPTGRRSLACDHWVPVIPGRSPGLAARRFGTDRRGPQPRW
ncbi:MAG: response regulator [Chthoniobacteraceae bacterium]